MRWMASVMSTADPAEIRISSKFPALEEPFF